MILLRIAHHLQQQQWTAVLIELVIVVLGVFLGFQVTDWASERASRSAETRHLEEIAEDLRADAEAFDGISRSAAMRISGIDYLLGETRGLTRPSRIVTPTGDSFDIPAGPPVAPADRATLLARGQPGSLATPGYRYPTVSDRKRHWTAEVTNCELRRTLV